MILGKIAFVFNAGPVILIDAALSAILLAGLVLGHKWAYVLTLVFTVFALSGPVRLLINHLKSRRLAKPAAEG